MPFQSAFTLGIIFVCFTGINYALEGVQYLETGKRKRKVAQTHFFHRLDQRDMAYRHVYGKNGVE